MRIAIVHYHLQPGGVTRVIELAARALASRGARIALLYGGGTCAPGAAEFPGAALAELAYSAGPGRPAELVVFDALPHSHWYALHLPETREALDVMVRFFNSKLA